MTASELLFRLRGCPEDDTMFLSGKLYRPRRRYSKIVHIIARCAGGAYCRFLLAQEPVFFYF